jgi:hypothetical protein
VYTDASGKIFYEDGETDVGALFERFMEQHKDGQRSGWLTRRSEITADLARLEGYTRRSNAQDEEVQSSPAN